MRYVCTIALATSLICLAPRTSLAQGSIDGFGGLSMNRLTSFGGSSQPVDFGGRLSIDLAPGIQAVGEAGRIGDVLPTTASLLLSFTPLDVRAPAFYGEGGVRFFTNQRSAVTPYVEATAGVARLDFRLRGLSPIADTATRLALSLLDRTDPMIGAGGGVMLRGGPVVVDLGYRYKQIFANDLIGTVIGGGQDLRLHQVRVGVGVRF